MLCNYCQKPISLLRRLSDPEFCSPEHRASSHHEQSTIAMARLRSTSCEMRAARTPVVVLEPIPALPAKESPARTVLAGLASLPPRHTRQYWNYELPAEPMPSPAAVMLQAPQVYRSVLAPRWATSVISFWPVPFVGERTSQPLTSPAHAGPALPASPLRTLFWILPESLAEQDPAESATQSIPLRILPSWSLPRPYANSTVAAATSLVPLRPSVWPSAVTRSLRPAPAVSIQSLPSRRSSRLGVAIAAEPVGQAPQCLWTIAHSVGDVRGLVIAEEGRYSARLERQVELMAENVGLCPRVAMPIGGRCVRQRQIAGELHSNALLAELAKPRARFRSPVIPASAGMRAIPLPPVQNRAVQLHPVAEATPGSGPIHFPAPPSIPQAWAFVGTLLPSAHLRAALSPAAHVYDAAFAAPPAILRRPVTKVAPGRMADPWDIVAVRPPVPRNIALPSVDSLPKTPKIRIILLDRQVKRAAPGTPPPNLLPLRPSPALAAVHASHDSVAPRPWVPIVIVPHSSTTDRLKTTALNFKLFSLAHLAPGPRKHFAAAELLDPCRWRARPVMPTTNLPRISLKEKNLTRTIVMNDARNAIQKETIDRAKRFWQLAPADLKWLSLPLPLIIGFWLWPTQPLTVSVPSPMSTVTTTAKAVPSPNFLEKTAQTNLNVNFGALEERIANRASIHLEEDFSAGLGMWDGEGNWARSWAYDNSGVVRPGRMAIYQPSIPMVDYVFDITAAVERRSISWMVRASNLRNYVAARLNVSGSGPNQRLSFERWTVNDGRVTRRQTVPIQSNLGTATTIKIRMEVTGNTFATTLQDQTIDVFTDSTHPSGGIGLFSGDADQPRIYRIELTHQHDFFGKLCSFLVPHPITNAGTSRP